MPALTPLASASSFIFRSPFVAHAMKVPARRLGGAGHGARLLERRDLLVARSRRASTSCVCSPSPGPGRRRPPGVRDSFTGTPELPHPVGAGLVELHHHLARAHELRVERLVEVEHRLEAAVVIRGELAPLLARALEEDPLHLGVRLRARRLELLLDQVLAPDAAAPRLPELRLERAERDPAVLAGVRPVADEPARRARASPRSGTCRRRSSAPATIASQDSAPSAIETSTSWPSPERSRSRSAARMPNAAISAPPPMSAIWPAGLDRRAVRARPSAPSSPTRPR